MEGPPLGPGGEDITWPDQVAPRGRKASSTRKIKPQTSNLTCLRGEARWSYLHAIPKTTMDERNGQYTQRVVQYAMILRHCECHG